MTLRPRLYLPPPPPPHPIADLVRLSCRHARRVVVAALILLILCGYHAAGHFAMDTDVAKLISAKPQWRQDQIAYDSAFPQLNGLIAVVVDGATPERADQATRVLAERLADHPERFDSVRRPDGSPYFRQNGLLFLDQPQVEATARQLIAAQPFLGTLAADPSLRGVLDAMGLIATGVAQGAASLDERVARPFRLISDHLDALAHGDTTALSWSGLIDDRPADRRSLRRFILVKPKLDYSDLTPGVPATDLIRASARELGLDPAHGVTVRLTGDVPMADEEFATIADGAGLMSAAMIGFVLLMLWLAVRSWRVILAILLTLITGLVITADFGLLTVGAFNPISVAFIPLFVGLGVDFGIQFSVRFQAERQVNPTRTMALIAAGRTIGSSLILAAGATAAGFYAFLPTAYLGVSQLGLIAGTGMFIALGLSLTLLPALLALFAPDQARAEVGWQQLERYDHWFSRQRRRVVLAGLLLGLGGLMLLPQLGFDFNPLHLRDQKSESVATLLDLGRDVDTAYNTIEILTPSLATATALANHLGALPEVAQARTIMSFVPADQGPKLAVLKDAADLLSFTLDPLTVKPPPTDLELVTSLKATAEALKAIGGPSGPAAEARRLAQALAALAAGPADQRQRATAVLAGGIPALLTQIREVLSAKPVTLDDVPADLKRDWITPEDHYRVELVPAGDSSDNQTLAQFAAVVRAAAPSATGPVIAIQEAGQTIVGAFTEAGVLSLAVIIVLLAVALRRPRDILLALLPLTLAGVLTLATAAVTGLELNFANIIALPLLFGVGVAFDIYFVLAWREGERHLLSSSLTRAVLFSALTTASAFGSLWLSSHPGTASMGELLLISLAWTLAAVLLFQPALMQCWGGRR